MDLPVNITFTGATPGADTTERSLYDSTVAAPMKRFHQMAGLKRFDLDLAHSHGGTLTFYSSKDRGTSWITHSVEVVAAPAANTTTRRDFNIEPYDDVKFTWTNGGSAQTTWKPQMALSPERAPAS